MTIEINERTARSAMKLVTGLGAYCFIGATYASMCRNMRPSKFFNFMSFPVGCFGAGMGMVLADKISEHVFEGNEHR